MDANSLALTNNEIQRKNVTLERNPFLLKNSEENHAHLCKVHFDAKPHLYEHESPSPYG